MAYTHPIPTHSSTVQDFHDIEIPLHLQPIEPSIASSIMWKFDFVPSEQLTENGSFDGRLVIETTHRVQASPLCSPHLRPATDNWPGLRERIHDLRRPGITKMTTALGFRCSHEIPVDSTFNNALYCDGLSIFAPVAQLDRASVYGTEG